MKKERFYEVFRERFLEGDGALHEVARKIETDFVEVCMNTLYSRVREDISEEDVKLLADDYRVLARRGYNVGVIDGRREGASMTLQDISKHRTLLNMTTP